ncbi:MAG: helix-turn-helix transcriptional regulator [Anaerolineaceae bacterium]
MTFGQYIAESRKKTGLSQKDLAERLRKEDGQSISSQYLNDIEHDRRNPPGEFILLQISSELNLSLDYLRFLSGTLPDDIKTQNHQPEEIEKAFKAFRKVLKGNNDEMGSR